MKEDGNLTPGSKSFWDQFYDTDDGRLIQKERNHHRTKEIKEGGSLIDHYEWFLSFSDYGPLFLDFLNNAIQDPSRSEGVFRVLHVGCGNSNFSDEFSAAASFCPLLEKKKRLEVLNVDICENIIAHLSYAFPDRLYAVGNCCQMKPDKEIFSCDTPLWSTSDGSMTNEGRWYDVDPKSNSNAPLVIRSGTIQTIFDKGTLDALLSAFPGEFNPNAQSYAEEAIRICMAGGIWYIISINAVDLIDSYVLPACDGNKSFRRVLQSSIPLSSKGGYSVRVETLGSIYHCYGFVAVMDE